MTKTLTEEFNEKFDDFKSELIDAGLTFEELTADELAEINKARLKGKGTKRIDGSYADYEVDGGIKVSREVLENWANEKELDPDVLRQICEFDYKGQYEQTSAFVNGKSVKEDFCYLYDVMHLDDDDDD